MIHAETVHFGNTCTYYDTGINEKLHTSIETYMYVEMYNSF